VQIKIHHKFRKHGCAFMLEFGIFGAGVLFLFYLFCFKTPFGKDFRKIEKRIKKIKKRKTPSPAQSSSRSRWLFPTPRPIPCGPTARPEPPPLLLPFR